MKKKAKNFAPQVFTLPKGLDRKSALSMAKSKSKRDWRGFSYNSKTGKATLV